MLRDDIIIEDTTLRDGEQAAGVAFSKRTKLRILDALREAGLRWIEVGIPAMGGEERDTLRAMAERRDDAVLVAWNRGLRDDVAASLDLGFRAVHIGLPTSAIHLADSLRKGRDWLVARAADLVRHAKDRGAFVSISAEDVGRTEPGFLRDYAGVVAEAGADRLRLSDTVGMLTPEAYAARVRIVRRASTIDIQCHCHNDFGLAVANTLAGLKAGARYFHVCVNGMGERAGMPDLAQMVMALKHLYGRDLGLATARLKALSESVAGASGDVVPRWQPIVGDNVFAHESGIHANGMLRNSATFEPFPPDEVGGVRRYVVGKHSGRALIAHVLGERYGEVDAAVLGACLDAVRATAIRSGRALDPDELRRIYERLKDSRAVAAP